MLAPRLIDEVLFIAINVKTDFVGVARSLSMSADELLLWHYRYGHRNMIDVCAMLGIPVPKKLPLCIVCVRAKSTRHPLGRRAEPLYDAPRPGYAWVCDYQGPFRVVTPGGNLYHCLKVDVN